MGSRRFYCLARQLKEPNKKGKVSECFSSKTAMDELEVNEGGRRTDEGRSLNLQCTTNNNLLLSAADGIMKMDLSRHRMGGKHEEGNSPSR
jgi:hypothetical protein